MKTLEIEDLYVYYGRVEALHGVSMSAERGEVTALLGANGAGKTTTLRAISGMVKKRGKIQFEGGDITGDRIDRIARRGIAHVAQGRGTLTELTVEENLLAGAFRVRDRKEIEDDLEIIFDLFPRLKERSTQRGGSLSGGEQQMLAVGRALMMKPSLLLLDEPSLGLAPTIIENLFATLQRINQDLHMTMLIVEQNANLALGIAHRAYVLEAGEIVSAGAAEELLGDDRIRAAYLGI